MRGRCSVSDASPRCGAVDGSWRAQAGVRSGEDTSKTRAMHERHAAETSLRVLSRTPCRAHISAYSG